MASTSLFLQENDLSVVGAVLFSPIFFLFIFRFAVFASHIHSIVLFLQTLFKKWSQKSGENTSPERDSKTVSHKHSEDRMPTFCSIFFGLLTFLGKTQVHLSEDARIFWKEKPTALSLSIAFGLSVLDKYQAASGDFAASSKWKGTWNLTYKEAYPSCCCMKSTIGSPHKQGKVVPFLPEHGNGEDWIRFFSSGDYFIGRRMNSAFFSTALC